MRHLAHQLRLLVDMERIAKVKTTRHPDAIPARQLHAEQPRKTGEYQSTIDHLALEPAGSGKRRIQMNRIAIARKRSKSRQVFLAEAYRHARRHPDLQVGPGQDLGGVLAVRNV